MTDNPLKHYSLDELKAMLTEVEKRAATAPLEPETGPSTPETDSTAPDADLSDSGTEDTQICIPPDPSLLGHPLYRWKRKLTPRPPELAGRSYGEILILAADGCKIANEFLRTRQGPPPKIHYGPNAWLAL